MEAEIWKIFHKSSDKCPMHLRVIYEISNYGRVKRNGVLIEFDYSKKYLRFYRSYLVHRVVAELFVPNPNPKEFNCVDHINGDCHDNRAINLQWCTYKMNANNPITRRSFLNKQQSKDCREKKSKSRAKYLINHDVKIKDWKWMNDHYDELLLPSDYWGEFIDIGFEFGRLKGRRYRKRLSK